MNYNATRRAFLASLDADEQAIMHSELIQDLNRPIRKKNRINVLLAIGHKMLEASVPEWEQHIERRAHEVGLSPEQGEWIVARIITSHSNVEEVILDNTTEEEGNMKLCPVHTHTGETCQNEAGPTGICSWHQNPRCKSHIWSGRRCLNRSKDGSGYCPLHKP